MSYEVMPFESTEHDVLAAVPTSIRLTVTTTQKRGLDATLELTERLLDHGYAVAPHLPARLFIDQAHVRDVVARLREKDVRSVFVIGGDSPTAAGRYADAYSLLQALREADHPFDEVGIGGYPEGHANIPQEAIELALKQKAPMASHLITQMCFDTRTTVSWARRVAEAGIEVPIRVGMPGPVNRQKLVRVSAGLGLGQSARFLRKQQSVLWRFLLPGGYDPTKFAKHLGAEVNRCGTGIRGLHIFTFNELRRTEAWRQKLLALLTGRNEA
ncbi:5,10-methylenetetrahydrofolate reductase [Phytoactinopolyspora sp. XMNu-373]|uniref:Methylenetetrahydrofolate reductase n=2 Tax=Phytoactinopolyspora mesophila TaxID=2650750 RepID=A0A7K3LZJ4_9ACTN|nr:5,10-methylenetetrahydrofolate reductase [Phytoactinopolyspora mesophila]